MPAGTALSVRGLSLSLGGRRIIGDLSFTVGAGRVLAIIGPSGSGKTVLLKALIGALPAEGSIEWAPGTRIGYVPQKLDLARDLPLTGVELLAAKCDVMREERPEIDRVLGQVELSATVAGQSIGTLSGGQFQRLLLAFALLGHPTVLLFDEPTAGMDEPGEESVYALFERLTAEGIALLLVSHELTLVYRHADEVLCLSRRGNSIGPPLEILTPERLQEVYGRPMRYHGPDGDAHG